MRRVRVALAAAGVLAAGVGAAGAAPVPLTEDVVVHAATGLGEPQVAVHPRDRRTVVVGENNTGVSVSHDAGRTWAQVDIPNQGDNVLAVQADGTFTYSSLSGDVQESRDRGRTWRSVGNWVGALAAAAYAVNGEAPTRHVPCNAPAPIGPTATPDRGPGPHGIPCDRPWLTADATRPGLLHLSFVSHSDASGGVTDASSLAAYVACKSSLTTNPVMDCGRQWTATSRDGGRTWGAFHPWDDPAWPAGGTGAFSGQPVASDGTLAAAYLAARAPGSDCAPCVVFQTSRDDGRTWQRRLVPASTTYEALGSREPNPVGVNASVLFSPYVAGDPSRPGRYALVLFDEAQERLRVLVTADAGRTWSATWLREPGGVERWHPWVAYGPDGALGVLWRTTYPDGSYAAWAAVSPRGGTRFARPVRLSSALSPGPVTQVAGDDASGVALDGRDLVGVWGDRRGGELGVRQGRYSYAADPAVRALR